MSLGYKVGYVRVSTREQHVANQVDLLMKHGIPQQLIFIDVTSGTIAAENRPQYQRMMKFIKEHRVDELYLFELSRLGRTFLDTLNTVVDLERAGTKVVSLSPAESWMSQTEPTFRNLVLTILSWVAERERANLIQRISAGQERARAEGKHIGRPKRGMERNPDKRKKPIPWNKVDEMQGQGVHLTNIARLLEVPYSTLWRANNARTVK